MTHYPNFATPSENLRAAFESRLERGYALLLRAELPAAMLQFEEAHIIGQSRTLRHLRSHVAMLRWGWQARSIREIAGQLSRILGAALFTRLWLPRGNPGSTRVGAFTPQPIRAELEALLNDKRP